jgi:hypothetical protein
MCGIAGLGAGGREDIERMTTALPAAAWLRQWSPLRRGAHGAAREARCASSLVEHRARKRDHHLLLWAWLSANAARAPL